MLMKARMFCLVQCVVVLFCAGVHGAPVAPNASLERAKQWYVALRFDDVQGQLSKALRFKNSLKDLSKIYELQGLTYAALNKQPQAIEAFTRLLMIDPDHTLPDHIAPRMKKPLELARMTHGNTGWLRASDAAPSVVYPGDPITVEIRLENDPLGMVDRFRVTYRINGRNDVRTTESPAGPTVRLGFDINIEGLGPNGTIEYWTTLLDRHGGELGFVATKEKPALIQWTPRPVVGRGPGGKLYDIQDLKAPESFYTQWWFWTGVGVVVAGTATALVVALHPKNPNCTAGDFCGATIK